MKRYFIALALLIAVNCDAQKQPAAKTTTSQLKLTTTADSTQYALGAFVGLWITTNALSVENNALFQKGLDDVLKNRARLIADAEINRRITAYQESMLKNRGAQQEKDLFASLNSKPGVGMFPNGVRYIVLQAGKGARPLETDSLLINLKASLPDGTVVEDTYKTGKPFAATVMSFFPGLNEALPMMPQGSKWQLYVPAALAYGEKGNGLIPANTALVLEVELMEVKPGKKAS